MCYGTEFVHAADAEVILGQGGIRLMAQLESAGLRSARNAYLPENKARADDAKQSFKSRIWKS